MSGMGSNHANEELRRHAERMSKILDDIAELQEDKKQLATEIKAQGYDSKAFNQIVKEMRKGADYQASQLELELVLDTYRKAVDLPSNLEAAQEKAREQAQSADPPRKRSKRSDKRLN